MKIFKFTRQHANTEWIFINSSSHVRAHQHSAEIKDQA